jgi:hypothetical protein
MWQGKRDGRLLREIKVTNLNDPQKVLRVMAQYGPVVLGPRSPAEIQIKPMPILDSPWNWIWRQKRHTPVALTYPRAWSLKTQWVLPQGWGIDKVPENWEIASFALNTKGEWFLANGMLEHRMVWSQEKRNIASERYSEAIVPASVLEQKLKEPVSIIKGGARGADYDGTPF